MLQICNLIITIYYDRVAHHSKLVDTNISDVISRHVIDDNYVAL